MLFDENINYGINLYQGHAIWLLGNDVVGFCNEYPILVFNDIQKISQTLFFYILKQSMNRTILITAFIAHMDHWNIYSYLTKNLIIDTP